MRIPPTYEGDASLPRFFRKWLIRRYGSFIVGLIDRAGRYHDYLTDRYPNTPGYNRRRFIRHLRALRIPKVATRLIHAGLWLYDHCPSWMQKLMKRTT